MIFRPLTLFALIIFSCGTFPLLTRSTETSPTDTPSLPTSIPATTELLLTATPLPTATLQSESSPTEIAIPVVLTPAVDFADLMPYRQAMQPAFASDVDDVAAEGVSQYYIEATLNFEAVTDDNDLTLTGTQRVRYTNNEDVPLDEIYFRLYPNLPGYGGQMTIDMVIVDDQMVTLWAKR